MDFKGQAIRATEASIAVMAAEIGVPYFRLRGVIEVEAPRGPFDRHGRPAMLFEPFHFYRRIPEAKQDEALAAGVAETKQPTRYPAESYTRLAKAMEIDEKAALESCSWGRGQIMGFNHRLAGYPTVYAMVEAFKRSESEQLRGMVRFIKASGLVGPLKAGNARAFARGYNGRNYARGNYHGKIDAAWARWRERPAPDVAGEVAQNARPPASVAVTKEGAAAGTVGTIAAVEAANQVAKTAKDTGDNISGFLALLADPRFLVVVALLVAAGLIWWWRRKRIAEEGT